MGRPESSHAKGAPSRPKSTRFLTAICANQCDGQYVTDDASIFDDPLDATRPYESLFHDARGHFPSLPSHDRFDGDSFP